MASRLATAALIFVGTCIIASASGKGVIDSRLQKRFLPGAGGGSGGEPQNVMVSFTQNIQTVFQQINRMNFSSKAQKNSALTSAQMQFTEGAQRGLKTFLSGQGVQSETFWIANKMIVPNASPRLVNAIASFPGVAKVEEEPVVNINLPFIGEPQEESGRSRRQADYPWGIKTIRANEVWDLFGHEGAGIVVANIDTGVRGTHQSLRERWRSSYGWYDPYSPRSRTPNDGNGHGTHTMGTIAGGGGIGVAPKATWIACKGCNSDSCGGSQLFKCGEWIQCPYPPGGSSRNCDSSKAPHIVSNSWGGGRGSNWYDSVITSWQTAGIIPIVSIGNSGPNCDTANTPGDRPKVIGVGSTDEDEKISRFSSLGPTTDGKIKPDIAAPGGLVYSAWHTRDNAYNTISGTSMACPHVSGVVALMLNENSGLNYDNIYDIITGTAVTDKLNLSTSKTCGGVSGQVFPNNVFGYGRIDAVDAVYAS